MSARWATKNTFGILVSRFRIFYSPIIAHVGNAKLRYPNCDKDYNEPKQPPEVFYKKGVLKNFAKFTGKHLCQSLFFNKVAGLSFLRLHLNEEVDGDGDIVEKRHRLLLLVTVLI